MISSVYNEINPVGFDFQVAEIQSWLAQLNLIQGIFGVARLQIELRDSQGERRFPQGKKLGSNVDLTIDDSYTSRVFFLIRDPISTSPSQQQWDWAERNPEIKQPFSIILHCSLTKLANQSIGITSQEQVKLLILQSLNKVPKIIVNSMSENINDVWKEFTMTPEINGFGLNPFYALRIDADCYYYPLGVNGGSYIELPRYIVGWTYSKVKCNIVSSPSGDTQTLSNGEIIPLEYVLNMDNTVTIPYLNSVAGINVLTYFSMSGEFFEGDFFIGGKINTSIFGDLGIGDKLMFDAVIPLWNR